MSGHFSPAFFTQRGEPKVSVQALAPIPSRRGLSFGESGTRCEPAVGRSGARGALDSVDSGGSRIGAAPILPNLDPQGVAQIVLIGLAFAACSG